VRLRSALLARRASDEISWGHDVFFHSVPAAHTLVRGVNGTRLRRHSADSTLPPLWPTGSSSGWLPSIPARSFSAGPSDSTSRWTPCPPRFPSRPARRYPRLWIWCSPSKHQWDFNPPEHVAAQRTLRAHPSPSRLPPSSWWPVIWRTLLRPILKRDEEGFSSCFARPCLRAAAATPPKWADASASMRRTHVALHLVFTGWAFGTALEATSAFAFAAARRLARHPVDGFCR
jgi:hypothetical protein